MEAQIGENLNISLCLLFIENSLEMGPKAVKKTVKMLETIFLKRLEIFIMTKRVRKEYTVKLPQKRLLNY